MAQINHSTRTSPAPYRAAKGTFQLRAFPASTSASTATIRFGNVVEFDGTSTANHRIIKSFNSSNAVVSTAIVGLAMEAATGDGSGVGTENIVVCLADKDTEFKFPTKLTGANHASSLVGTRAALIYDSTAGFFYAGAVNSTTAENALLITDVIDAGTTNGYVAAKFISTNVSRLISGAF